MSDLVPKKDAKHKTSTELGAAEKYEIIVRISALANTELFSQQKVSMLCRDLGQASTTTKLDRLLDASFGNTRVGDQERDTAIQLINEHYIAGRLTLEESNQRRSKALEATTQADLVKLLLDLPAIKLEPKSTAAAVPIRRKLDPLIIVTAAIVAIVIIIGFILVIINL